MFWGKYRLANCKANLPRFKGDEQGIFKLLYRTEPQRAPK